MPKDLPARVQGQDSIVIDAPLVQVWPLIGESRNLARWGPPVIDVSTDDDPEGVGSRRTVTAKMGRRTGTFRERRIIHEPPQRMAFVIETDTFGLARLLRASGTLMELEATPDGATRLTWTFFHQPHSILGHVMNPAIRRQQRRNRLLALASLKAYAEHGTLRPQP